MSTHSFFTWTRRLVFDPGHELDSASLVARTVIVVFLAIVFARMAKKRFIAQASAIDLMIAVIFGSLLSRSINGSGNVVDCITAGLTMVVLQRVLEHASCRSVWIHSLVKGHCEPIIVDGVVDEKLLQHHGLSHQEPIAELRLNANTEDPADVRLAVFERSGQVSALLRKHDRQRETT